MNSDRRGKRKEEREKRKQERGRGKKTEREAKNTAYGEAVSSAQLSLPGDNGCGGVTGMNVFISD